MKKSAAILVAVPVLLGAGYFIVPKANPERFLLTGSSTIAPILQLVAEDLHAADPGLVIDVETGGSSRGIQDAQAGQCDVGMASRDLKPEEKAGLDARLIAYDGVALIVNRENPIAGLDHQQVIDIYTGVIGDWKELGAGEGEIHVVNKAEGRATLTVFLEHFKLKSSAIQADAVIGDNAQGVRMVAGNPDAIAYVSIGEALSAVERGEAIRLIALDGIEPTKLSVADGSYPLRRNLYLLFPGAPDASGERILAHLASARGREILTQLGFTPTDIAE
ncbi:MAG: phosphate ABC transporter substrate-binding protein [Planctomycetes bacterium]|nr:phosphate ABC transporter substrate-binding protein [Planctomycetota bacterium]